MRHGDVAWSVLVVGVTVYEVVAARRQGELLSEAMDRYRSRHPVVVHVTVGYLAGHLLRRWPSRLDPLHLLASRLGR